MSDGDMRVVGNRRYGRWRRNPNFSTITLRFPLLFQNRRAWMRQIVDMTPGCNPVTIEYATDQQLARIALQEAYE